VVNYWNIDLQLINTYTSITTSCMNQQWYKQNTKENITIINVYNLPLGSTILISRNSLSLVYVIYNLFNKMPLYTWRTH